MTRLAATLFVSLLTLSAQAAAAPPARRVLTPDDFYNMQIVSEPQVSPDGQWVAYVVSTNDRDADESRNAIWMVSWDGAQQVQLTNPTHDIGSPRWSPDGRFLAYMSVPSGVDKSQIMLLDRRGGEAKPLTTVTEEIESYEWSPDSKRLVLVMEQGTPKPKAPTEAGKQSAGTEPANKAAESPKPIIIDALHFKEDKQGYLGSGRNHHLYLLEVGSRRLEALTSDPAFNEDGPVWSPDGHRIAFVRTHEKGTDPDNTIQIALIEARPTAPPAKAAQPAPLLKTNAPNQQKLRWSPDGKTLAFLQGVEAKYGQYSQDRLAAVKVAGGSPEELTDSLDRGISSYVFNKDGATITATIEDDATAYPVVINLRTHAIKKLSQGLSVTADLSIGGGHAALLSANDSSPTEVYALEGDHLRKLTKHNDALMAALQLGTVEDLRYNSADGTPIHGLLVKPPGFESGRTYPTVLWIHGGPNLQDSHSFAFDDYQFKRQLLAARGFAVFGVNYRGSSGRGSAFSRAVFADWGHKEVEDVLAGTDSLIQQGIADAARVGIGGWSYGGMLTDYTITADTRFKVALSGAGTGNPLALYAADQYYIQYNQELGDPWRNTALYIKLAAPLLHADRIRTPTLFMGGDKDFNVPIVGGEQMYLALRTRGVPAQLVVYPGEYHTLTRPSFLKDRAERMDAWFSQYLISSLH